MTDIIVCFSYDTSTNWIAADRVILNGEACVNSDDGRIKVGWGGQKWSQLDYIGGGSVLVTSVAPDFAVVAGQLQVTPETLRASLNVADGATAAGAAGDAFAAAYTVPAASAIPVSSISGVAGTDVQTVLENLLPKAGGTLTGALTLAADPVNPLEPATKQFAENLINSTMRDSVVAASTGNLALTGAYPVDGTTLADGDRYIAKDQTTASQNGIYIYNSAGAHSRATDTDTWEKLIGASTLVLNGTINVGRVYKSNATAGGTLGTTAIAWVQSGNLSAIPGNSITNAKLVSVATATIKGRATAGTGSPEDLTAAQARTVLDVNQRSQSAVTNTTSGTVVWPTTSTSETTSTIFTGTAPAITVPSNANQAIRVGARFQAIFGAAGTIVAGGGATLAAPRTSFSANESAVIEKVGTDAWRVVLTGDVAGGGGSGSVSAASAAQVREGSATDKAITPAVGPQILRALRTDRPERIVNLISNGNNYNGTGYTDGNLDVLFPKLLAAGITGISLRTIWQVFETWGQTLSSTPITNLRRIAKKAESYGLDVHLDFHTLFSDSDQDFMIPYTSPGTLTITGTLTAGSTVTLQCSASAFTSAVNYQVWQGLDSSAGIIRIDSVTDAQNASGTVLRTFGGSSYAANAWKLTRGRYFAMWDTPSVTRDAFKDYIVRMMQHDDGTGALHQMTAWKSVSILNEPFLYWAASNGSLWSGKNQASAQSDFHRVVDLITTALRGISGWQLPIGIRFLSSQGPWRTTSDIKQFSTPAAILSRLNWIGTNIYWESRGTRPTGPWDNNAYADGTSLTDANRVRYSKILYNTARDCRIAGKRFAVTEFGPDTANAGWRNSTFAWARRRFDDADVAAIQNWNMNNDQSYWSSTTGGRNTLSGLNTIDSDAAAYLYGDQAAGSYLPAWPALTLTGSKPNATLTIQTSGVDGLSPNQVGTDASVTSGSVFALADFAREIREIGGTGRAIVSDYTSQTEIKVFHVTNFASGTLASGNWEITDAREMSRQYANRPAVNCDWSYDVTMTVPADTFEAGDRVRLTNINATSDVTIAAGAGVTERRAGGAAIIPAASGTVISTAELVFISPNEYSVVISSPAMTQALIDAATDTTQRTIGADQLKYGIYKWTPPARQGWGYVDTTTTTIAAASNGNKTFTIPANTLSSVGDSLEVTIGGILDSIAGASGDFYFKVDVGGSLVLGASTSTTASKLFGVTADAVRLHSMDITLVRTATGLRAVMRATTSTSQGASGTTSTAGNTAQLGTPGVSGSINEARAIGEVAATLTADCPVTITFYTPANTTFKFSTLIVEQKGVNMGAFPASAVTPEMFRAVGDGSTNDTAAYQAASDYATANKRTLVLRTGAVYYIDNWVIKNPGTNTFKATDTDIRAIVVLGNGARIKFRNGGDNLYGCAQEAWQYPAASLQAEAVASSSSGYYKTGYPVIIKDVFFDGNNAKTNTFVHSARYSWFWGCNFTGCVAGGTDFLLTPYNFEGKIRFADIRWATNPYGSTGLHTGNGADGTSSASMINTYFIECVFRDSRGYAFWQQDRNANALIPNPGSSTTDCQMIRCFAWGTNTSTRTVPVLRFEACGGWIIQGHFYADPDPAEAAKGSLTFTSQPAANSTLTLNGSVWTFKSSGATGQTQSNIGATVWETIQNFLAAAKISTDAQVQAIAMRAEGRTVWVGHRTPGTAGNSYTLASSATSGINVTSTVVPASALTGSGAPANGTGVDGNYYLDTAALALYGPKASGAWPGTPVALTSATLASGLAGGAATSDNQVVAVFDPPSAMMNLAGADFEGDVLFTNLVGILPYNIHGAKFRRDLVVKQTIGSSNYHIDVYDCTFRPNTRTSGWNNTVGRIRIVTTDTGSITGSMRVYVWDSETSADDIRHPSSSPYGKILARSVKYTPAGTKRVMSISSPGEWSFYCSTSPLAVNSVSDYETARDEVVIPADFGTQAFLRLGTSPDASSITITWEYNLSAGVGNWTSFGTTTISGTGTTWATTSNRAIDIPAMAMVRARVSAASGTSVNSFLAVIQPM